MPLTSIMRDIAIPIKVAGKKLAIRGDHTFKTLNTSQIANASIRFDSECTYINQSIEVLQNLKVYEKKKVHKRWLCHPTYAFFYPSFAAQHSRFGWHDATAAQDKLNMPNPSTKQACVNSRVCS